ncbi:MAG TPA: glycosyltransferase family 87 protein [Silvibacterium sp.]|nr:glycosyltransferase family 87 protein [Silvibacterium sp.]
MESSTLKTKPVLLAWCMCFLLMELCGAGFARSGTHTQFDFRSFYTAGYLARTAPSKLYDLTLQEQLQDALVSQRKNVLAFYHPSYETLLYAPFSMLSYRSAYLTFIAFNMLLLLAAIFAARPLFPASPTWLKSRPWLAFFLYLPAYAAIVMGQDSILLLLLCCIALQQLESGNDLSAGCLIALALFKFQIITPIAALIAIRRGWRFASGFLLSSAGVALLCLAVGGRSGIANYFRLLSGAGSAIDRSAIAQQRLSVFPWAMPNAAGLLYACGARFLRSPLGFDLIIGLCSLALFAWCASVLGRRDQKAAYSIAILCGLLVSYHLYLYDLTPSILMAALLAGRLPRYILAIMFLLPVLLLPLGSNSFFLLAIPVLAMLIYTLVDSSRSPVESSAPMQAAAI